MKNNDGMWELCPICKQMRFSARTHKCPQSMLIKREVEIEGIVDDETLFLDVQIDNFWNDPHVKFMQYLVEHGEL